MRARSLVLAVWLAAPALARGAEGRLVAAFDDPPRDDAGPGTYVYPGDVEFRPGTFDLRRFAVFDDGETVGLEVTLGAPIRRPEITQRTNETPVELTSGVYLQNVDIYVDTDVSPGSGFTRCIPGRRVALGGGRTWEHAIVLTPQPGPTRAVVEDTMGAAARAVIVPDRVEVHGSRLVVRIPAAELGGVPQPGWGWSVHVSGARWERSYSVLRKDEGPDAFTMPVLGVREAWAFGGAPKGDLFPRVVDVLLPAGVDQKAVLGSYGGEANRLAEVPFVSAEPYTPPAAVRPGAPPDLRPRSAPPAAGLTVADLADDVVSIAGPVDGLKPLQLGRVVDEKGETVARIVVLQVLERGLVARAVDGQGRITRGAKVVFDP